VLSETLATNAGVEALRLRHTKARDLRMGASASADAGSSSQVQYRTFSCNNGNTYTGGFVGFAAADFFIVGTTETFAIKVFTEFLPSGPKTFYTGISGFDPSTLVTCSTQTHRGSSTSSRAS
jgi:hypothetical protein